MASMIFFSLEWRVTHVGELQPDKQLLGLWASRQHPQRSPPCFDSSGICLQLLDLFILFQKMTFSWVGLCYDQNLLNAAPIWHQPWLQFMQGADMDEPDNQTVFDCFKFPLNLHFKIHIHLSDFYPCYRFNCVY